MIYEYSQPVPVMAGPGAIKEAGAKLKTERGVKRIMLVYDEGVKKAGIGDKVVESMKANGITCCIFDKVIMDSPDTVCDELGNLIRSEKVDAVVAVGGGSTLDTSKSACVVASNGGSVRDYLLQRPFRLSGEDSTNAFKQKPTYKQTYPLVCVPTTSGTGSEIRITAAIHDTDLHLKDLIIYVPWLAVLDPELLVTMPPLITSTTAFDAMAHANESMTGLVGQQKLRNTVVGAGVTETVFEWLPIVMKEPTNLVAREKIAVAANLAALCSLDGLAHIGHNMADAFNYNFGMGHGHGCALALPVAIEAATPWAVAPVKKLAKAQGLILTGKETPEELGALVADKYRELARTCNIPSLKAFGVTREQVLADKVIDDCFHLQPALAMFPSGKGVTREEMTKYVAKVYDGYQ